jgi:hypothetical protein
MSTIMLFTPKAGLRPNDRRKLKAAGIIAIQVDDPTQIQLPNAADINFASINGDFGILMLRAMTAMASQTTTMEMLLGRAVLTSMKKAVNMDSAGNVTPKASK